MLAFAIALAAIGFKASPGGPSFDGALGHILGSGILHLLPAVWGHFALAAAMLVVAIGSLYMACALTLGEWHIGAKNLNSMAFWGMRQIHRGIFGLWHLLRNEQSGGIDDFESTMKPKRRRRAEERRMTKMTKIRKTDRQKAPSSARMRARAD